MGPEAVAQSMIVCACYDPTILRIRCKVHEDERRSTRTTRDREKDEDQHRSTAFKKKIFIKKCIHGTHIAEQDEPEEEEDLEDQEMEEQPGDELGGEEDGDEEDNETSEGELEEGELKEAFAAGWKAKKKGGRA